MKRVQQSCAKNQINLGDRPTYITFDIDCLDPAFAPGTGTPVWGGLSSGQAAILLRDIAGINMIGGDVVEVSPSYDTPVPQLLLGRMLLQSFYVFGVLIQKIRGLDPRFLKIL